MIYGGSLALREGEYSFYSHVYNVYTQIDYFLVDAKLHPYTCNVRYHDIIISDHSPLTFSLRLADIVPNERAWRLNPQLLTEPTFCEHLKEQITFFFDTNDNTETSPALLCETLKVYLRGCIISFQTTRSRQNRGKLVELEGQIHLLDRENASHLSMEKHNKNYLFKIWI